MTAQFAPLAATARVAICAPVAFEIGYSARSHDDYTAIADRLGSFPSLPVTAADHRRALEVGRHSLPVADTVGSRWSTGSSRRSPRVAG